MSLFMKPSYKEISEKIGNYGELTSGETLLLEEALTHIPYAFLGGETKVYSLRDMSYVSFSTENKQYSCLVSLLSSDRGDNEVNNFDMNYYRVSDGSSLKNPYQHRFGYFTEEDFDNKIKDIISYQDEKQFTYDCEKLLALVNKEGLNSLKKTVKNPETTDERESLLGRVETVLSVAHALLGKDNLDELRIRLDQIEEDR